MRIVNNCGNENFSDSRIRMWTSKGIGFEKLVRVKVKAKAKTRGRWENLGHILMDVKAQLLSMAHDDCNYKHFIYSTCFFKKCCEWMQTRKVTQKYLGSFFCQSRRTAIREQALSSNKKWRLYWDKMMNVFCFCKTIYIVRNFQGKFDISHNSPFSLRGSS